MPHKLKKSRKEIQKMEEELAKTTHFKKHEVKCLLGMFSKMDANCEKKYMDRGKFREVIIKQFNITDNNILDRLFKAFDKDNDSKLSPDEWVRGMSIFLRGNLKEHIKFCFDVYDLNSDGWISKEEMFQLLKDCLPQKSQEEDPDEGVKDLVDSLLKKLDTDGDLRVSFDDYYTAVQQNYLLLETLGACLPNQMCIKRFIESVDENILQ